MYKYLIIFLIPVIVYAESNDIQSNNQLSITTTPYQSYSYSLMDELKLSNKNEAVFGKQIFQKSSKALAQKRKNNPNLFSSDLEGLNNFSIYSDDFRDILDIESLEQGAKLNDQYTIGNFSAKLDNSLIKRGQSKVSSLTLHVNYEVIPGIFNYIETSHLRGVNTFPTNRLNKKSRNRSTLFLIGTKIEF